MKKNRRSKIGRLRTALLELLAAHSAEQALPTSARFLFYELVQRGIISKERKAQGRRPDQNMSDALTDLRERGEVPWEWIVDETRALDNYTGASSLREWDAGSVATSAARSLGWRYTAYSHREPIAGGGFTRTRPRLRRSDRRDQRSSRRLFAHRDQAGELAWERLALTQEQVDQYDLPVIEKHDRRYNDGHPHLAVETEAIGQRIIVDIVRSRLEQLLPEPLRSVQVRADAQRSVIQKALQRLR
jgi:hypothetical protein